MISQNFFYGQCFDNDERGAFASAVGDVWLYFYKSVHIGTYCEKESYLLDEKVLPMQQDGYSDRHLITREILDKTGLQQSAKRVDAEELLRLTFHAISDEISKEVDRELALG